MYNNIRWGGAVHYSLEECVIGTWIDGKPLYQKTVTGTVSNYSNIQYISIGASIDSVCNIAGVFSNNSQLTGMTNDELNTGVQICLVDNASSSYPNTYACYQKPSGKTNLVGRSYVATFQYTKTTD